MAFATTIYFVWNERNKRIFTQEQRNCQDLSGIVESIKMKLMSLKVKKSIAVEEVRRFLLKTEEKGLIVSVITKYITEGFVKVFAMADTLYLGVFL
ncbi:hypothetical protein Tco_0100432, partial [Tanacetum coccineum]